VKLSGSQLIGLGLVGASFALHIAFYDQLPDPVPRHWNIRGVANGFTPKPWGAFVNPLVMAFVWLVYIVAPIISPRRYELGKSRGAYDVPLVGVLSFLFIVTSTTFLRADGWTMVIQRIVPLAFGVLLIVLGNYMGKIRRNFFIGLRTPWILADEEVWLRSGAIIASSGGRLNVVIPAAGLLVFARQ